MNRGGITPVLILLWTLTLAWVLCAVSTLQAQINAATLVGTITDSSGAVVPDAEVILTNLGTGISTTTHSSSSGEYTISNLDAAHYSLTITHAGFQAYVVSDLTLEVGQKATQNVTLNIGASTQKVIVTAAAPLLATSSSEVSQVVTSTLVSNLPLNGRQFWQLTQLTPGAQYTPTGQTTVRTGGTSIRAEAVNVVVNGIGQTWTGWSLDGANITEFELGGTLIQPNVDALQEFRVESADMSAQYGHTPTMINAVLKSGTNHFHGSAFDYLRNDITDARNFFAVAPAGSTRSVEPLKRNQFGGTLGGPILRDRVFFFADYQGTRLRQGNVFNSIVPDAAERGGDFSELLPTPILNPTNYTAFMGNIIPPGSGLLAPQSQYLMSNYMPLPNFVQGTTPEAVYTRSTSEDQDAADIKVNATVTSKDTVMNRYSISDNRENDPSAYPAVGFENLESRAQDETLQWTRILNPHWINVAQFGYYRSFFLFNGFLQGTPVNQNAGILGFNDPVVNAVQGMPEVNISGFYGFYGMPNDQRPKSNRIRTWEYADTVGHAQGRHDMKIGVELFHRDDGFYNGQTSMGDFSFNGMYSGNAMADFVLGYPNSVSRGAYRDLYGESGNFPAFFIQDNYRIKPNLTLNLGLRWEFNTFFNGTMGEISGFNQATGKVVIPSSTLSPAYQNAQPEEALLLSLFSDRIQYTSALGLPESIRPTERRDGGPRVGIAWSPLGSKSSVIRAAYGLYYGFPDTNNLGNTVGTVPFLAGQAINNSALPASPALTFGNFFANTPLAVGNPNPGQPCSFGLTLLSCSTPTIGSAPIYAQQMYVSEWNLSVQHQFTNKISLDVAYVGNNSMHLQTQESTNDPLPGPGNVQNRRPLPQWSTISIDGFEGHGYYNALQTKFELRDWHNLSVLGSYSYQKDMDNGSNESGPPTTALIPAFFGITDFDLTHSGVASFDYALPVGKGKAFLSQPGIANKLLGDWTITGIATLQSGLPFTPTISKDVANTGVSGQWPNRIGQPLMLDSVSCWFYTSSNHSCAALAPNATNAFVLPATYTYGNGGRNILRAEPLKQFDFGLMRNIRLTESKTLQFRAEAFNLFNHPVFAAPSTTINTSSGGVVTSTLNTARVFEFAMKFLF